MWKQDEDARRRWYRRHENNGWRLLNEQAFGAMVLAKQQHDRGEDPQDVAAAVATAAARSMLRQREAQRAGVAGASGRFFHPIRAERRAHRQMRARRRQYQWMKKIEERVVRPADAPPPGPRPAPVRAPVPPPAPARPGPGPGPGPPPAARGDALREEGSEEGREEEDGVGDVGDGGEPMIDDDDEFLQNFMDEESDLLAWTSALDYEAYLTDWHSSATTISTEARRNTLGYESWLSIRRAQERALEYEYSMQSHENFDSAHSLDAARRGAGSIASVYTDAEEGGEYR